MAKGQGVRIPDNTRAAVVAALLEGQAVTKVADDYKIDKGTVSRLKKTIPADKLQEVAIKKGEHIAELISANLEKSFLAIGNILKQTENADWLTKQNASDLATLLGVTSDKVFRVLEAIQNAQVEEVDDAWPSTVR